MAGFGTSPFGSVPFAASAATGGTGFVIDLASNGQGADAGANTEALLIPGLRSSATCAAGITDRLYAQLVEAMVIGGQFAPELLPNLIARVNATGTVHAATTLAAFSQDSGRFDDAVTAAWMMLLADNLQAAGAAAGNIRHIVGVIDTLAALGVAETQMMATAAAVSAMTAEAIVALGFSPDVVSAAMLQDTAASIARMLAPLLDTATGADTATPALRLTAIASETAAFGDDAGTALRAALDLSEDVLVYGVLRLGGAEYSGWVMNAPLRAVSQHTHGAWDSFASFRGKHYAAGAAGIAVFTGTAATDTAAGTPVDAFVRTAMFDFGSSKFKRVPDVFIGVDTDGRILLKVRTRDREAGAWHEDWYEVERIKDGPGTGRAKPGRGLRSTWWQFEIRNIAGADLALDRIEMRPLMLDKRT